jgi:hypothetical protein
MPSSSLDVKEQPFPGGAPERRAVRERRAEVGLPRVEVGVKVHQGDGPNRDVYAVGTS